jgi:hypothetical protein
MVLELVSEPFVTVLKHAKATLREGTDVRPEVSKNMLPAAISLFNIYFPYQNDWFILPHVSGLDTLFRITVRALERLLELEWHAFKSLDRETGNSQIIFVCFADDRLLIRCLGSKRANVDVTFWSTWLCHNKCCCFGESDGFLELLPIDPTIDWLLL